MDVFRVTCTSWTTKFGSPHRPQKEYTLAKQISVPRDLTYNEMEVNQETTWQEADFKNK